MKITLLSFACLSALLSADETSPSTWASTSEYPTNQLIDLQDSLHLQQLKEFQKELEVDFVNQPICLDVVQKIEQRIRSHYQKAGYDLVAVKIPDQEVSEGVVQFNIEESRIGKVSYQGREWDLDLQPGTLLNKDALLNDIAWLNRNPFHYTTVVLSPGKNSGTTDVEVVTKDRLSWRFYAGADNTGTEATSDERIFAGFNWGNALWIDDLLTFQYTASPDFHRFRSYLLNYTSFLPWKHSLTIYGGYAQIHPDIDHFRSEGKNAQASLRYGIPFKPLYKPFTHELTFGFDYKFLNNNLFFESDLIPFMTQAVDVTQFYLGYMLKDTFGRHELSLKAEIFASPFTHAHYHDLRPHSHSRYLYGRVALGDLYQLPKRFAFNWLFRGAAATGPLLASEQFGLGGYDTVRGYEERIFNVDKGVCANVELHSPSFSLLKKDTLYFLAFVDYGWGHNDSAADGLPSTQHLWGVGPGLRYRIGNYLTARLDYGFQLHSVFGDDHFGRWHFSVSLSY